MKKRTVKNIMTLLLAAILVLSLAGCGADSDSPSATGPDAPASDNVSGDLPETTTPPEAPEKVLSLNEDNLYMIYTADDLVLYRDMFDKAAQSFYETSDPSDTFLFPGLILMDDIDLSSVCSAEKGSWKPIGRDAYFDERTEDYKDECFTGIFDGNGKTISGLYINDPENGGALIQCLWEGTVQNLTVTDSTVSSVSDEGNGGGSNYCAVLAVEARDGLIENCVVADSVTIEGDSAAAAFIAKAQNWNHSCAVKYSKNYANIKTSGVAGGIIASASAKVYIIGCENHGNITTFGDGATYIGGIIGAHTGSSSYAGRIYGCINYGDVTETINQNNGSVAGIAGKSNTTIEYCVNAGNITAIEKAFDITHYDSGSRHYNANYGTVSSNLDPQYAISAVYRKSSYKGIHYPIGTPALTDGTALAEIIDNAGNFWKQGEQFPVWNGEFRKDFPNFTTRGSIAQ